MKPCKRALVEGKGQGSNAGGLVGQKKKKNVGEEESVQGAAAGDMVKVESVDETKEHPLLNDLVLRNVVKWCQDLEEVKRNRLVCRAWKGASEGLWTKLTKILTIFQNQEDKTNFGGNGKDCITVKELKEKCDGIQSPLKTVVPYRKFKLQDWEFGRALRYYQEGNICVAVLAQKDYWDENWFWNEIAPQLVTQITIDNCVFPFHLKILDESFFQAFSNLEKLSIGDIQLGENAAYRAYANLLESEVRVSRRYRRFVRALRIMLNDQLEEEPEEPEEPEPITYKHQKLRSVTVKAWNRSEARSPHWQPFLGCLPNLEYLRVLGPKDGNEQDWGTFLEGLLMADLCNVASTLKHMDLLDFSTRPFAEGKLSAYSIMNYQNFPALEVLKVDLGYEGSVEEEILVIRRRMRKLKKLYVYQAPLKEPLNNFLHPAVLRNLTELHLWGVVSSSMNFLECVPSLEVLTWTTSGYDEEYQGKRLFQVWQPEQKIWALSNFDFLANSSLPVLNGMTRLELDWEPQGPKAWKKLVRCMPNLSSLKVKISSNEQLARVCFYWKKLERLELAHGSQVSGQFLIQALVKFQQLKEFTWKGCLCTEQIIKDREIKKLLQEEKGVRILLPETVIFPWHPNQQTEPSVEGNSWKRRTRSGTKMCVRGRYEKAIETEDPTVYTHFDNI